MMLVGYPYSVQLMHMRTTPASMFRENQDPPAPTEKRERKAARDCKDCVAPRESRETLDCQDQLERMVETGKMVLQ